MRSTPPASRCGIPASMAFGIGPVLTMAAIDALAAYGSDELKAALSRQARSAANGWAPCSSPSRRPAPMSARCAPRRDARRRRQLPHHRLEDLHHLWRARPHRQHHPFRAGAAARCAARHQGHLAVPGAEVPAQCDGIGARNDVRAHSVEHKLGIHASPTCTMVYGDKGGAIGFLIGEENKGMACMFTMMNRARLAVGLQGVAIAERATQQALAYARERKQGAGRRRSSHYPDVQAHAADHARARPRAARAICYATARGDRPRAARQDRGRAQGRRMNAPRCSRRSPRPSPPTSASRSPRSACRCMAAWASSRKPAPPSIIATRASPRSTKAPTASRRSIW